MGFPSMTCSFLEENTHLLVFLPKTRLLPFIARYFRQVWEPTLKSSPRKVPCSFSLVTFGNLWAPSLTSPKKIFLLSRAWRPGTLGWNVVPTGSGSVAGSVASTCIWPWKKKWRPREWRQPGLDLDLDWVNMTQQNEMQTQRNKIIWLTRSTLITKLENPNPSGKVNQRSRLSPEVFFLVWCPYQFSRGWRNSTLSSKA